MVTDPLAEPGAKNERRLDSIAFPPLPESLSAKAELEMIIGVPKEVKLDEYRVAMLPVGVEELTRRGHKVLIEVGAGLGSGLPDTEYAAAGAELALEPAEIFARA